MAQKVHNQDRNEKQSMPGLYSDCHKMDRGERWMNMIER